MKASLAAALMLLAGSAWAVDLVDTGTGIALPPGFKATVFADGIGTARHLTVAGDGTVYVRLQRLRDGAGVVALRDDDGDGVAERSASFFDQPGTGIQAVGDALYVSTDNAVYRLATDGELGIAGAPVTIVGGFEAYRQHAAKTFVVTPDGDLFVNVGAPSNNCQVADRTPGSPGREPCDLLERTAGIWRFDANTADQSQAGPADRYVTGIRNAVALDWNPADGALYFAGHGRDQLDMLWPDLFSAEQNAELPAEVFHKAEPGADFGWPRAYWDPQQDGFRQSPEYGGDGTTPAAEPVPPRPVAAFPAHWGPNDLVFCACADWPEAYRGAAFIAFHGSWNRAPLPQAGFNVAVVPMAEPGASAPWFVFADGFAGATAPASPRDARHRPSGLAVAPDGALLIADSAGGRIWRVVYHGDAAD